jgi:two-component system response regulator DevR
MSVNAETPVETPVETPEQGIRVYILDDHDMIRRGLRDILAEAGGFEVIGESGSAREAARRIPALRPDVALLDVQMPDGSGGRGSRSAGRSERVIRASER